jgi:RNA polymerase sigma factor (sigma-70 family)
LNFSFAKTTTWNSILQDFSQKHWKNMYYFALQLCRNKVRAEDITQTALLRAVKYFPNFAQSQFNASSPADCQYILQNQDRQIWLRNWLMKIVKNVFLNDAAEMEKWSRSNDLEECENTLAAPEAQRSFDLPLEKMQGFDVSILENAFFKEAADDTMKHALEKLNPRQKSVLFLIAEGYAYKEVASILEVPMGTVMSTLSRAIAKVKSELAAHAAPESILETRFNSPFKVGGKHATSQ